MLKRFIVLVLLTVVLSGCTQDLLRTAKGDSSGVLPNPARLYTKWNSWKGSVEWTEEDKQRAVRYMDMIFAVPLNEMEHMRALKQALNPDLLLLRYINIWPRGAEKLANYTDQMMIHRDWPNQNDVILKFRSLQDECNHDIVDVSRQETRDEMARVIRVLLDPQGNYRYDGVHFDLSAW